MEKSILSLVGFRLTRINFHTFSKFAIISYKPPEKYLNIVDFVAERLMKVKGICQRNQKNVYKIMIDIIDKGFKQRNSEDESIEMRVLKNEMISAIRLK